MGNRKEITVTEETKVVNDSVDSAEHEESVDDDMKLGKYVKEDSVSKAKLESEVSKKAEHLSQESYSKTSCATATIVVLVAVAVSLAIASDSHSNLYLNSVASMVSIIQRPLGFYAEEKHAVNESITKNSIADIAAKNNVVDRSAILKVASEKTVEKKGLEMEENGNKVPVAAAPVSIQRVFLNDHDKDIEIYWHNPDKSEDIKMSSLAVGGTMNFNTFINHVFKFKEQGTLKVLRTLVVNEDYDGLPIGTKTENKAGTFEADYYKSTGRQWLNTYRQKPTKYHIWDMENVGDEVEVTLLGGSHSGPNQNEILPNWKQSMKMVSKVPKIFYVDRFMTDEETDYVKEQAIAKGDMKRSTVSVKGILDEGRTSSNTWLNCDHSPRIMDICIRGFDLVKIPFDSGNWSKASESFQVVHYGLGQEYRPHHDYFAPAEYPNSPSILNGNNRLLTLFVYLNDVESGGETVFPRHNGDYVDGACDKPEGFKVTPKKGAAAIFYSMLEDGNLDVNSLHGGCPVKIGEKWGANLWFWDEYRN